MAEDSLLTSTHREVIENEPVTGQKARQDRMRMRNRVTQGLHDCAKLSLYARDSDIEKIFHRDDTDRRQYNNTQLPDERKQLVKAHWVPAMHMVALLWRGLRLNGMDKHEIFQKVIEGGIVRGESDYVGIDRGSVESDISLNKLEARPDVSDPLERWKRDLSMSGADFQELTNRLNEHPEVESIVGEDISELIEEYLIEDDETIN